MTSCRTRPLPALAVLAPALAGLLVAGCSSEARELGPTVPQTRPTGAQDRRIPFFKQNLFQVSQGGRYFSWYGCQTCHNEAATGVRNLADGTWRRGSAFDRVYAAIADRHGALAYGSRIPVEQLWQLTAYVRDLPLHTPEKRRRQLVDQQSEPVDGSWTGPQR